MDKKTCIELLKTLWNENEYIFRQNIRNLQGNLPQGCLSEDIINEAYQTYKSQYTPLQINFPDGYSLSLIHI